MDWAHAIGVSSDSLKKEENKNKSAAKKDIKKTGLGFAGQILGGARSEEHTSELQSLMRISYAVFCLKKKIKKTYNTTQNNTSDIKSDVIDAKLQKETSA